MHHHSASDPGNRSTLPWPVTHLWSWLIQTPSYNPGPMQRRARLLSLILIFFSLAGIGTVVAELLAHDAIFNILATIVPVIIFIVAFGLNRAGGYSLAAALTIVIVFSTILVYAIPLNTSYKLHYVLIALSLSSLILSTRLSIIIFAATMAGMLFLPLHFPDFSFSGFFDLMYLFGFIGLLGVISSAINRQDIKQIEQQSRQLMDENSERRWIEVELRKVKDELELKVDERTAQLQELNLHLNDELIGRNRVEETLRKSEERYRTLAEAAQEVIFIIDREDLIEYVNEFAANWLGRTAKEIVGQPRASLFPSELAEKQKRDILKLFETGEVIWAENKIPYPDGVVWLNTGLFPLRNEEGEIYSILGISRDVTENKQIEEALRQNIEKLTRASSEMGIRNREMALLSEMGNLIQACQTDEESYAVIAQYASRLFKTESGALFSFNAARNELYAITTWGQSQILEPSFSPNACWALRRGRLHVVENFKNGMVCSHLTQQLPGASLCIPLMAQGETLGVFTMIRTASLDSDSGKSDLDLTLFPEAKLQLGSAFAEQIGLALANLNLRDMLRYQSIRDPLTNLYNRRYMEETLERELMRAERKGTTLGIIMLDIDYFKRFNDTFGHEAGDIVLRDLGNFFQTHIRAEDIACRYGGEEFILILPDSSLSDTLKRAEDLGEGIKQLNVNYNGRTLGVITVSSGISMFPDHGKIIDTLLRAADQANYRAKAEGRDRVVVAN